MGGGWVFALLVSLYGHLCWLSVALTVNPHIHYTKQLKHRYCCCRPLVVTFVCYEFGTLSCATKLEKGPHFWTKYSRDWKCSSVISPDDIWALICWHLSFWGCKGLLVSLYDNLTWPSEAVPFLQHRRASFCTFPDVWPPVWNCSSQCLQVREAHTMQEVNRKFKRGLAEYEAAIEALKVCCNGWLVLCSTW